MLLYLSEEAKLGIVSGAIAILILMVICMVCKLSRLKEKPAYRDSSYLKADDKSTTRKVPMVRFPGFDAECSDCEQEKRAKNNDNVAQQTSVPSPPKNRGSIKFSMIYQSNVQILLLNIIEANQLVGKDFWDTVDSYVKTRLQPDNDGTFRRQSQVVRKSKNPRFTENYEFHLSFKEVQNSTLYLSLWEIDKYSRHYMIGELQMKLDQLIKADESVAFNKELKCFQETNADLGEILFSLSYMPTAERMSVVLMKARNLNPPLSDWDTESRPINPFVKVVLLFDGKKVKKKKTSTRRQENNPVYNECMMFDVPPDLLHRVLFVISVADSNTDSTRSNVIGRVVIGSATTGEPLRHWHQMLISPRRPVAAWHRLRL
ncbi:synaptotagmin-6-like [Acropora millepora]|uniref:synaptotagmin-6-like n=1 Tax=Acropora millepora TaxID=45264 RepID=UPI001CF5F619|nr:synaptotagmin-6-like [Acropora millepora]